MKVPEPGICRVDEFTFHSFRFRFRLKFTCRLYVTDLHSTLLDSDGAGTYYDQLDPDLHSTLLDSDV